MEKDDFKKGYIEIADCIWEQQQETEIFGDEYVGEATIKRHLANGDIPSEPRQNKHEVHWTHPDSLDLVNPGWDLQGVKGIAKKTEYCTRHIKRLIKTDSFPVDRLFGRWYSCVSSVQDWIEKRRS